MPDAKAWLSSLGVERWDTFPPQEGRIRWMNGWGDVVASGRYEIILSWGPGMKFNLGWNLEAYPRLGIPFVRRELAGEPGLVDPALEHQAFARAEDVARKIGADFAYQCSTLLVAVHDVQLGAEAPPERPAKKAAPTKKPAAKKKPAARAKAPRKATKATKAKRATKAKPPRRKKP